jgi:hypothetical protein
MYFLKEYKNLWTDAIAEVLADLTDSQKKFELQTVKEDDDFLVKTIRSLRRTKK